MTEQQINLGQMVGSDGRYELSVSNESPEDAAARRSLEAADAALKRRLSLGLFVFALILASVVFAGCVYVFAAGSADDKKWAAGIVSAITSGLVGFMVGQARR
jgi:lipopolysaccharide export LptBFGC system permease protein LptF